MRSSWILLPMNLIMLHNLGIGEYTLKINAAYYSFSWTGRDVLLCISIILPHPDPTLVRERLPETQIKQSLLCSINPKGSFLSAFVYDLRLASH